MFEYKIQNILSHRPKWNIFSAVAPFFFERQLYYNNKAGAEMDLAPF